MSSVINKNFDDLLFLFLLSPRIPRRIHADFLDNFPRNVADLYNAESPTLSVRQFAGNTVSRLRQNRSDKRSNSECHSFTADAQEIRNFHSAKFSPRRQQIGAESNEESSTVTGSATRIDNRFIFTFERKFQVQTGVQSLGVSFEKVRSEAYPLSKLTLVESDPEILKISRYFYRWKIGNYISHSV